MGIKDDINRILRDHEGYTDDGRGGVGDLPIGDRSTARKPISKRDLREVLGAVHDSVADPAASAVQAVLDARAEADRAEQAVTDAAAQADRAEDAASGVEYPVSYAPQTLTAPQRAQARSNINTLEEMRLYGVGSLSNVPQGGGLDMDDPAIPGGEYAVGPDVSPATVGTWPDGLNVFHGVLIVHRRASTTGIQYLEGTANSETTSRTWRRRFTSGIFQTWEEIPSRGFATPAEALAGTATDKVMSPARVAQVAGKHYWQFTASGTWTKPAGLPDDTLVFVEAWGGGQSGARHNSLPENRTGGSGGDYTSGWFRAADLPATMAVAIGAGGAALTTNGNGNVGGATTFGALLSVPGGGVTNPSPVSNRGGAGGAGATGSGAGGVGGSALRAGAGGGGASGSAVRQGGLSQFGGNGGAAVLGGTAGSGQAPGGGGGASGTGTSGAGARGELRVWI